MAQRVRKPYRGQSPSSVTQLPILTALHARLPTLFAVIIHHNRVKVNINFQRCVIFLHLLAGRWKRCAFVADGQVYLTKNTLIFCNKCRIYGINKKVIEERVSFVYNVTIVVLVYHL